MNDLIKSLDANLAALGEASQPNLETAWSDYQEDFFQWATDSTDNLVVEAVAGSGKTTTLLECMRRLPTSDVLFLAFNKSIKEELQARVPMGVTVKTLNALGHSMLLRKTSSRKVSFYKNLNILRDLLNEDTYKEIGYDLSRQLSSAVSHGMGLRTSLTLGDWIDFVQGGSAPVPDNMTIEQIAEILRLAFDERINRLDTDFDFDDQIFVPLYYEMTFPKYDVVFVDEAQDLSAANHLQLQALANRGARIIAVGDSHQAIYAFRGADTKSMSRLADRFLAEKLPLSICYRCDTSIVAHAQTIVPHIQPHEERSPGEIIHHDEYPPTADYAPKSMIVCRNNAPLFKLGLQFLQEKTPCFLVMDFAKQLTSLIDKLGGGETEVFRKRLLEWQDKETKKAERQGREHLIDLIEDKVNCLLPFCDEYQYALQIKGAIQTLTASTSGPRLSTIHKAKGLEAEDVYILRPDLMPSARAVYAAEHHGDYAALEQEDNLRYVAITRAQHRLHYLPSEES